MTGDAITRLPAKTCEALERSLAGVPITLIDSAAIKYQLQVQHPTQPGAAVRAKIEAIEEQAAALYVSLGTLSIHEREALRHELEPMGGSEFWEQANFVTQALMGLARNAASDVEVAPGRPASAKHGLVRSFARILTAHGRAADSRPNGDLCFLVREVLNAFGDAPADVRALVRDALGKTVA